MKRKKKRKTEQIGREVHRRGVFVKVKTRLNIQMFQAPFSFLYPAYTNEKKLENIMRSTRMIPLHWVKSGYKNLSHYP